ncbi:MAG: glucosamine-6-phosphate deaminase [Tannerella sp.]|jgi:glucosamine-6-phosphate deaminase|nr:glucosamine-6-phosphate deaminase [Tannerella sp.]
MSTTQSVTKDNLQVRIHTSRQALGESAAADAGRMIRDLLQHRDSVHIIFAAAPSQNEFLDALCREPDIDWRRVRAFHMDEYVGLAPDAPQRFGNYLDTHIFGRLPFLSVEYLRPDNPAGTAAECSRYAALLQRYPADIVCMGIGENGHLAFNDPHVADFNDPAWVKQVNLDADCRRQQVNDGCFTTLDEVPAYALTLTIPVLMRAAALFCMVPGRTKAQAVRHTLHDPVSEKVPATCLRLHPHATLYVDTDSAPAEPLMP